LGTVSLQTQSPERRKTVSFGSRLPHVVFHTTPYQVVANDFLSTSSDLDPFDVANCFLQDLLDNHLSEWNRYFIRKDSYTDQNTGVTHIYARQIVNGLEVVDGNINLNIKDGQVLSFGNSFYIGPIPSFLERSSEDFDSPHAEHCLILDNELRGRRDVAQRHLETENQIVLGSIHHGEDIIGPLERLYQWNCAVIHHNRPINDEGLFTGDLREALLHFMAVATPNDDILEDISARFEEHVDNMSSTVVTHFMDSHVSTIEFFDNVPDTVNPVKARLVYAQVPKDQSTVLQLAWRVCRTKAL